MRELEGDMIDEVYAKYRKFVLNLRISGQNFLKERGVSLFTPEDPTLLGLLIRVRELEDFIVYQDNRIIELERTSQRRPSYGCGPL